METVAPKSTLCLSLALFALGPSACSSKSAGGGPQSATSAVAVSGTVYLASELGAPGKLSGADVKLAVNGSTLASAKTDAQGAYALSAPAPTGSLVVVTFDTAGAAPVHRTIRAGGQATAVLNATLRPLKALDCSGDACSLSDGKLALGGLPAGASGSGRVFNPVTESSAFPGSFADDSGNLLVSGVFASMKLSKGGQPLETTASPVELTMALPRDTWPVVRDVDPATTDRVEVPLYSFDEASGQWKRDGQGILVDDSGALINGTTDLASVVAGTWAKGVNARGPVTHFSYWNVDWPIDKHTCVTARLVAADGRPAVGATATVRGISYTGSSDGSAVGADGRFCADVMRSEGGRTETVSVTVSHGGEVYGFGPFDTSTAQATCGGGGCADLGDLRLDAAHKLAVVDCTLSGTVVNRAGAGVADATVIAWDDSVPEAVAAARCQVDYTYCFPLATTSADGSFTVKLLVMENAGGMAFWSSAAGSDPSQLRYGSFGFPGCPAAPVQVVLADGYDSYASVAVTASAGSGSISWTPAVNAGWLMVSGTATPADPSGMKWMVSATNEKVGFPGPVIYGAVPAGAAAGWPPSGSPTPMAEGDVVDLWLYGMGPEGFPYFGSGQAAVGP